VNRGIYRALPRGLSGRGVALLPLLLLAACAQGPGQSATLGSDHGLLGSLFQRTPPALETPRPDRMVGKAGTELAAVLGPPDFSRKDGPAEVWNYRAEACELLVFLYPDNAGRMAVSYAETSPKGAPADCLKGLGPERKGIVTALLNAS